MDTIDSLLKEFHKAPEAHDELVRAAKQKIARFVSTIFRDMPDVHTIVCQGYTPHFNDGDVCRWTFNAAVDVVGLDDVYYYKNIDNDENNRHVFSGPRTSWNDRQNAQWNRHREAIKLMNCLSLEFEVLDNDNGTLWVFTRADTVEGFITEAHNFEHD